MFVYKQIVLITEKTKGDMDFALCLIVSFRFFKVTDVVGFAFAVHCNWFVKTS